MQSWGKIQGTATDLHDGKFTKVSFCTKTTRFAATPEEVAALTEVVVAELAARVARNLELAREWAATAERNPRVDPKLIAAHRCGVRLLEAFTPATAVVAPLHVLQETHAARYAAAEAAIADELARVKHERIYG